VDEVDKTSEHWFLAENPLLEGIPQFSFDELAEGLSFSPFAGINWATLSSADQLEALRVPRDPYEPTKLGLRAAANVLAMLRGGLRARNPLLSANRRALAKVLQAEASGEVVLPKLPHATFSVQVWMGITGTGKSALLASILRLLPEQVIERDPCPDLWTRQKQLLYLVISMSHDGSRGGLLEAILEKMDDQLGTTYAIDLPKQHRTVERLVVATVARMHAHYLGLFVLEEAQWRNLVGSAQAEVMQLFLLALMNTGIPVLMIGNPRAFDWITEFSQDMRRLNEHAIEYLHPVGAMDEPSSKNDWDAVHYGVTNVYVLPLPPRDHDECKLFLKRASGGIPGLALTLWCNAQKTAIEENWTSIGLEDLKREYEATGYANNRRVADAFHYRDAIALRTVKDAPFEIYEAAWGKGPTTAPVSTSTSAAQGGNSGHASTTQPKATAQADIDAAAAQVSKRDRTSQRASSTRVKRQDEVRQTLRETLSEQDMRIEGLKQHAIEGLNAILERVAKNGK